MPGPAERRATILDCVARTSDVEDALDRLDLGAGGDDDGTRRRGTEDEEGLAAAAPFAFPGPCSPLAGRRRRRRPCGARDDERSPLGARPRRRDAVARWSRCWSSSATRTTTVATPTAGGRPRRPPGTCRRCPNDELEQVVAEHPGVVPMRLRLVERYLRDGRARGGAAPRRGGRRAGRGRSRNGPAPCATSAGRRRCSASPRPARGCSCRASALEPSDPDGLYFLGRVRFELLGDPTSPSSRSSSSRAVDMDDDQRRLVDELLAEVRVSPRDAD